MRWIPPPRVTELEVASREGRFEHEGWRIRKDGSHFWANVVLTALRGIEGEVEPAQLVAFVASLVGRT